MNVARDQRMKFFLDQRQEFQKSRQLGPAPMIPPIDALQELSLADLRALWQELNEFEQNLKESYGDHPTTPLSERHVLAMTYALFDTRLEITIRGGRVFSMVFLYYS